MARKIVLIDGHPDPSDDRFGHALANAYTSGAQKAGHHLRCIRIASLDFPILRSAKSWKEDSLPADLEASQEALLWADHLVMFYPLWLGTVPALLKAYLEQVFRPGFAADPPENGHLWRKRLTGKSARIVVTMGMPAWAYRWLFFAHSLRSLERNILQFSGIGPIQANIVGGVETMSPESRQRWLERLRRYGEHGR